MESPLARPAARPSAPADPILAAYASRGSECAYANLRMLARVAGTVYDDALRPVDLRAGQLALMWAILATGPVEIGELARITLTDQTTLSRTIAKLRAERLVVVRPGEDRRVKVVSLSDTGRRRFVAAMPYWEEAQRQAARLLPLADVRVLARGVRKASRAPA
jgi:DNA-binding MarR family transcriptional regulator